MKLIVLNIFSYRNLHSFLNGQAKLKRLHLFEFEDLEWFPHTIRTFMTDLLDMRIITSRVFDSVVPHMHKLLESTGENQIIDLCSGGGWPLASITETLNSGSEPVTVLATDKFPNENSKKRIEEAGNKQVQFCEESVDAMNVPDKFHGVRTLFAAFHHFEKDMAFNILKDAKESRAAIGVFEFTRRTIPNMLAVIFILPFLVLWLTPQIKPFSWKRMLFTYLIPLVPMAYLWDALVSQVRTYTPEELAEIVQPLSDDTYKWEIETVPAGPNGKTVVTSLIGYPVKA